MRARMTGAGAVGVVTVEAPVRPSRTALPRGARMGFVRFVAYGLAKTLSKVFGLATMAFFGRMPSRDDDRMALIGLAAITWIPVVAAIAYPPLGEFLIPFAPEDESLLRWMAIGLAVAIPAAVGALVASLHNHQDSSMRHRLLHVLHGFWYTPVIAFAVTGVIVIVPFVKTSHIVQRFDVQRLQVMIPEGTYDDALDHILASLRRRGIEAEVHEPSRAIGGMFRLLGFVLGHIFDRDVADRLLTVRGHDADGGWFEVNVHAADLSVVGKEKQACRVYAVLAEELDERQVYFTWDDDAQALEDRMRDLRSQLGSDEEPDLDEVRQLAEDLATLQLDTEEWNNIRRNLYRLERDAYARAAGREDPEEATRQVQEAVGQQHASAGADG
jgi:hypothetical protein